jgi:predicted ATP-binding protein involved in virulence
LPVVAFYTAERQWRLSGVGADTAVRQQDSRLDGYALWNDASLDMRGLETWIVAKSLEQLEASSNTRSAFPEVQTDENINEVEVSQPVVAHLSELELLNRAVVEAIPDAKGLRYDIKYRRLMLDWQDEVPTPFDTLSDGQRGMVALIADIARRMCLLNPQLGDSVLSQTPGVVLIDELDMHLHPKWQRRMPHILKKVFPKVQFIAASHSPQIIGELTASEVWLMRSAKVLGHPERALGLSSGEVLEELMEANKRNGDVDAALKQIRILIDDDEVEAAQALLNSLKVKVGDIPDVLESQSAIDSLQGLVDADK